jgi:hypothetical protein
MSDYTSKKVKIQVIPKIENSWDTFIDIQHQGKNHLLARWMLRETKCHTKKLPGGFYQNLKTGEVKEMVKSIGPKENHNLRVTFEKLRGLIRTNFTDGGQNQVFITLTFAESVMNPTTAQEKFFLFWKRLQYAYPDHKLDYISVIEPQGSGRWHFHVMVKSDQKELWIPKNRLKEIWGNGRTSIERLKSNDVGAYYVAYFTALNREAARPSAKSEITYGEAMAQIENEIAIHDSENDKERMKLTKRQIKGARLKYYPKGIKFYTCSKDIIRPKWQKGVQQDVESFGKLVHSSTLEMTDENGKVLNVIQKDFYTTVGNIKKRKKVKKNKPKK